MWILPKQLHTSASVADTKALGLDSEGFSQICERSLTWRGKDSRSRTWLQRWKRESWIQHLCSRTLKPSHTESFVDAWTSSLADSRANHSALLESVQALKTQGISFRTWQTESESANLELFFSRTLKELSQVRPPMESRFSSMSSESWKDWVTEQRQEFSQRVKSAHLTREKGSSSWATPQAFDHVNIVRTPEKLAQTRAEKNAGCMNLREQVHYPNMNHSRKAAKNWPTPTTAEGTKIGNQPNFGQVGLSNHPSIVGQPDRAKLNKSGKSQGSQNWPTPTANEDKDQSTSWETLARLDKGGRILRRIASLQLTGQLDQTNPNTNGKSQGSQQWPTPRVFMHKDSTKDRGKCNLGEKVRGKLNPDWVEQLMGLPVGWTDCDFSAME